MHLNHLNQPSTAEDSGKLAFLALTDKGSYFFECNNDELTPSIESNRKLIRSPAEGDRYVGLSSCNGLVCLVGDPPERPICICNPFTNEYVVLPEIRMDGPDLDSVDLSFGFGYVSLTNEYKVVGIRVTEYKYAEVFIYTLGSGSGWRDLGKFNSEFCPEQFRYEPGRFANGAIYWLSYNVNMILTFDLIEERFCEHLAPPPLPANTRLVNETLGVLDGFLYIAVCGCRDIWLLKKRNDIHNKKEGEEHQSLGWCKEFRVHDWDKFLAVTKSGGVLICASWNLGIYIYDTKASTSEMLLKFESICGKVFPHKNTFVSMKQLGEEGTNHVQEDTETMSSVEGDRKP